MLFAMAELGRSKFRFGLLTMGAGLLVFVLMFQQALLDAVLDGMAGAIKDQSGPVLVFNREAKRRLGAGFVTTPQSAELAKVPGVGDVGNLGVGLLSYRVPDSDERANVSVLGYQPSKPGTPTAVKSGRLPAAPDEIVISAEGAVGRFGIGDRLTFEPGDMTVTVVGFTEAALLNIGAAMWIPWPSYETLMRRTAPDMLVVLPAVLAVQPAPGVTTEQLIYDINATVPLDAVTREEAAESAPGRQPIRSAFLAVMTLCYVVVGVVIWFFFLILTLQKESSIVLLRAVGANARYLIASLLLEVAIVTFGGLVFGVLLLIAIRPTIRNIVIIEIDPVGMLVTAVPALAVAMLASLPPIWRVLRADPSAVVSRPSLGGAG